ncbi:MAG: response regulator [Phycisphaerae bacterium]
MSKSTPRLLVVEDDQAVRHLIRVALETAGLRCDTAASLAEARARMADQSYHLLLVDLMLPDGSGFELLSENSDRSHRPSVIIMTGHPSVDSAAEGMQRGARNYLTKPVEPDALVHAVRDVLAQDGVLIDSEEQFLAELGRRIKSARLGSGLTMRTLGERVGISQAQISQIEAGLSAPSLTTLFRLARALRVQLRDLVNDF